MNRQRLDVPTGFFPLHYFTFQKRVMDKLKRFELINQLLILEKIYPGEADQYAQNRKALEYGFALHYSWLTENLSDGLSEDECKEVLDIMDMYQSINFSWSRLNPDKEKPEEIRFKGFDGNNEGALRNYVEYFIIELDRYEELKHGQSHPRFNSHTIMLPQYKKQLEIWKAFNFDLTAEQISLILDLK
jgi:uncharacterized protein